MESVDNITYLGDKVSNDGKNTINIKERVTKGVGIISEIFTILENVAFGQHYFKAALLLRNSLLLSSCLYNADVWHNVSQREVAELSKLDSIFFSRLFSVPQTTVKESFFLETGAFDIETNIKIKRVLYYHSVVQRKDQLIHLIIMTQLYRSCKGDWILQVERDFHDFKIEFSLSFLEKMPKNKFKDFVSKQAKKYLYMKLYMKKLTHSKTGIFTIHYLAVLVATKIPPQPTVDN